MTKEKMTKRPLDMQLLHQLEEEARDFGRAYSARLQWPSWGGRKIGFALMLFSFDGEELTWISNANREDMLKALEEFKQKLMAGEADTLSRPRRRG